MSDLPEALKTFGMVTEDPHEAWQEGRERCPVRMPGPDGKPMVHIFTRQHAEQVLRDESFSASCNQASMGPFMGEILLGKDGREHTVYRKLVSHAFRASALQRWEDGLIRPTIQELLDKITPNGKADLVSEVTAPYPARIICGIIGVPLEDHVRFHQWSMAITAGPLAPEEGFRASREMQSYLEPIVEDRRREARDDLISDIVHAEVDGEKLDDEHIYGFLRLLMPAGAETTYREMGILILALLQNPASLERLRQDHSRIPDAIEETLRWDSSAPMVVRVAEKDVRVGDQLIPRGTRVSLALGSTNRDSAAFEDGDSWTEERQPDLPHFAFGWGRHLCLGMHLARLELRVGLEAILERLPGLRLDPSQPVPAIVGTAFRGPATLPVLFDAA